MERSEMTEGRYWAIEIDNQPLTDEEKKVGWHFCPEWDEMLIGPGMKEMECCLCKKGE
jgi:hypothetical protein